MTNSFLKNKQMEVKYRKQQMPQTEFIKQMEEKQATTKMTEILKSMHSPSNFTGPNDRRSMAGSQSVSRQIMQSSINLNTVSQNNIQLHSKLRLPSF